MDKIKQAKQDIKLCFNASFNALSNDIGPFKATALIAFTCVASIAGIGYSAMIVSDPSIDLPTKLFFTLFPVYSALSLVNIARKRGHNIRQNKLELK